MPMDDLVLVEYVEPQHHLMRQKRYFIIHMLHSLQQVWKQALIKWKDRPEEGSTWENTSVLRKCFPTFVFADENFLQRGM